MPLKPAYPPELLLAQRCILRRHTTDLPDLLFSIINQDRERLGAFLPWVQQIKSVEDERTFVKNSRRDWDDLRTFDYGIYSSQSNEFMGCVSAHSIRWDHDCCEIGFWISKEFEGQHYVTEAVTALEAQLFEQGFHRLEVRCDHRNQRSAHVAERAGYTLEGILRENLFERGNRRDTMIWGKIRTAA